MIQDNLGAPWLIAVMLAIFGVVLYEVDRRMPSVRAMDSIGVRTGLFLGVAQAMALQPGVSRSGVTMTAARAIGLDRETAARFSFLLSLPIIAGAGLYKGADLASRPASRGTRRSSSGGSSRRRVSGFLVIWGLLKYLKRHDFKVFMLYRLAVAGLVLGLIATGVARHV